ncbi:transposase family protein [Streptomyces virginiae]
MDTSRGPRPPDQRDLRSSRHPSSGRQAYQGAGDMVAVPSRRKPGKDLTVRQTSVNRAHSRLRWPVERAIARIKSLAHPPKSTLQPHQAHIDGQSRPYPGGPSLKILTGELHFDGGQISGQRSQ